MISLWTCAWPVPSWSSLQEAGQVLKEDSRVLSANGLHSWFTLLHSCGNSVVTCKTVTSGQKPLPQKDSAMLGSSRYAQQQQQQHNPAYNLAYLRCLLQPGAQPGRTEQKGRCLGQMAPVSGFLQLGDLLQVWSGRRVQAETVTLFKMIKVMHKAAVKSNQHRVG